MELTVNGKPATIDGEERLDITTLLDRLKVEQPDYVTVELNGEILVSGYSSFLVLFWGRTGGQKGVSYSFQLW